MLVQIYGLTTVPDAIDVDQLQPDHVGLVLEEGIATWDSVDVHTGKEIARAIEHARLVALSLSTDPDRILRTAELLSPEIIHLARAYQMADALLEAVRAGADGRELMLTVPVRDHDSIQEAARLDSFADYLLLDTSHPETGTVGATGHVHDWALSAEIVAGCSSPVILAGGLGPDNVTEAIERARPAGVDSETRTSRPDNRRRKDLGLVERFIDLARHAP